VILDGTAIRTTRVAGKVIIWPPPANTTSSAHSARPQPAGW